MQSTQLPPSFCLGASPEVHNRRRCLIIGAQKKTKKNPHVAVEVFADEEEEFFCCLVSPASPGHKLGEGYVFIDVDRWSLRL
jgi:hypothetical protein